MSGPFFLILKVLCGNRLVPAACRIVYKRSEIMNRRLFIPDAQMGFLAVAMGSLMLSSKGVLVKLSFENGLQPISVMALRIA